MVKAMKKTGRPPNERRLVFGQRYRLSEPKTSHLRESEMAQLDACQTDEARRLLLGVSHKKKGTLAQIEQPKSKKRSKTKTGHYPRKSEDA
jgi:hypothetical protein